MNKDRVEAQGLTPIGHHLPRIEPTPHRSAMTSKSSTSSSMTSGSIGPREQAAPERWPAGTNVGKFGAVMIGDGPDPQLEPEKVERHLRRIKSGLPASLVRQHESNEHMLFPVDGDPYSAERGPFHPPEFTEEIAQILQVRLDEMEPYMFSAERIWILGRCLAALSHYYIPDMPEGIIAAMAEDWCCDLKEFPAWAIVNAFMEWRRGETRRRPTPGDIRAKCQVQLRSHERIIRKVKLTLDAYCPRNKANKKNT